MKTESNVMYVVRLAGTLLLIAAIVAALLAGVNMVTAPIIEQLNYEKTQAAINAVLPGGGEEIAFTDDTGMVAKVYKSEKGYAVQVQPAGFDGTIDMMVGIDHEGKILGISIISHTETAGLGAVAAAKTSAGENFRGQFVGESGSVGTAKRGTGTLDAITGATITSEAVCTGVNAALDCVANLG
ncbi:MAG: RnfABCDGE type electron transport complex subunit G [Oscillospiraceae bacterium]|nr:RnfABCDGE type electron transport complex subunit G [Oscillospiraceae bacterium]